MPRRGHDILRLETVPPGPFVVIIIGGELVSGYQMIQYVADDDFDVDQFYDPTVDTDYISGLGYGQLYDGNGQPDGDLVLVRHNFQGDTDAYIAGVPRKVIGTTVLTVTDPGPDLGKTMLCYLCGFPAI